MLLNEFRQKGIWFIPGLEKEVVFSGDIIYMPGKGIKLELIPVFVKVPPENLMKCKFMYGKLISGKFVTLYDVFASQMPIIPDVKVCKYHANFGFIGEDYLKEGDLSFKSFLLKLNLLTSWFFPKGMNIEIGTSSIREVNFENEELTYELDFATLKLGNFWKRSLSHQYFEAKAETYIRFNYKENVDLQLLLKTVYQIQIFLSLIGGKNFYPTFLRAKSITGKDINILYSFNVGKDYDQDVPWYGFLFNFRRISNFGKTLANYFNSLKEIRIVYDLFYEHRFREKIPEEEFLNIARALEVYHRIKFRGSNFPYHVFEAFLKEIESTIYRKAHEMKIKDTKQLEKLIPKYANEPDLNKRLKELYSVLKDIEFIKKLLGGSNKKAKNFLRKVYLSRNYYTHFNPDLKNQVLKGTELFWANKKLGVLLEALLLKEIGFQDTELNSAFHQNFDYTQLIK